MLADEMRQQEMTVNGISDLHSLQQELSSLHPVFRRVQCRIAVNRKLVNDNIPLHTGDEIAVMPPFSGG